MPRDYSATELVASVQQKAFIAASARDFGAAQILRLFNEEIDGYLVPFVAKRRLEFWVESADVAVSSGVGTYPIPSVALGGKLRAIAYVVGSIPFLLDEIDLPMAVATPLIPLTVQYPSKYYFLGNSFVLWPSPSAGGTARIFYYRRPSVLVANAACCQITAIGAPSGGFYTLTCSNVPTTYTTSTLVDLVSNVPNFTQYANSLKPNAVVTGTNGTIQLPGTAVPTGLAVGDWICLYDTAPVVVGSPADLTSLLTQQVALKCAEAKGTNETIQRLAAGLKQGEESAGWTIQRRNEGAMRKVSAFPADSLSWPYPWGGG